MKKCRITVIRKANYSDLIKRYEAPQKDPCPMLEGQVFVSVGAEKPDGLCDSAWGNMSAFVMALAYGAEGLFDGWMKDKRSVMISCNDGLRPVSFLIEAFD